MNPMGGDKMAKTITIVLNGVTREEAEQKRIELFKNHPEYESKNPQGKLTYVITVVCTVNDGQATPRADVTKSGPTWNSGCGGCADCGCGQNPK